MSCIIIFAQHNNDVLFTINAYLRWIFIQQAEISPFKHHILYFRKGDYCEEIFYSLIYAANKLLIILILVAITVLTNVKYLNLNIFYIYIYI